MTRCSKLLLFYLAVLSLFPICAQGQSQASQRNSIQCGYHFLRKNDPKEAPIQYLNMRLDYHDGESVFYDVFSFERDSLRLLAFDENGRTKDQDAYQKIASLPRPRLDDVTIISSKNNAITQFYRQATITIRGSQEICTPAWELQDDTCTIKGYQCKKATAKYLGRTWTVWYTEDIPLPIGPWMLWGAPGLIVSAEDDEMLFSFQLVWTDSLDSFERLQFLDSRYPKNSYQKGSSKHFVLPLKEAEQMNYRLMTDASYLFELAGTRPMNTRNFEKKIKYIPIIHSDYWKGK